MPAHWDPQAGRPARLRDGRTAVRISVAAQLAGMHAQTLRSYDREGLVSPGRTTGGGRRYSQRDIELLREVQRLSQDDGVNRAGIRRIIELEAQVDALRERLAEMAAEVADAARGVAGARMDAANAAANAIAGLRRDVVPWQETSTALVAWRGPAGRFVCRAAVAIWCCQAVRSSYLVPSRWNMAALRAIPGLRALRPADANETSHAWRAVLQRQHDWFSGPVGLGPDLAGRAGAGGHHRGRGRHGGVHPAGGRGRAAGDPAGLRIRGGDRRAGAGSSAG